MAFFDAIERLQKRSPAARTRILVVSVAFIMSAVAFVWVVNMQTTLRTDQNLGEGDSIQPLALLGDIIKDSVMNAKDKLYGNPKP